VGENLGQELFYGKDSVPQLAATGGLRRMVLGEFSSDLFVEGVVVEGLWVGVGISELKAAKEGRYSVVHVPFPLGWWWFKFKTTLANTPQHLFCPAQSWSTVKSPSIGSFKE
jgi:hypothetical protein